MGKLCDLCLENHGSPGNFENQSALQDIFRVSFEFFFYKKKNSFLLLANAPFCFFFLPSCVGSFVGSAGEVERLFTMQGQIGGFPQLLCAGEGELGQNGGNQGGGKVVQGGRL